MNTIIVLTPFASVTSGQYDRFLEDLFEAMDYSTRTGFDTRVTLERFDKNGLPIYHKIPDDELTYIEWKAGVMGLVAVARKEPQP